MAAPEAEQIDQRILQFIEQSRAFSYCTVSGYSDDGHTAHVRMPEGKTFPDVPILIPFRGHKMPVHTEMQGVVLVWDGEPQVLLGVTYTTKTPIPANGLTLEEDLFVGGDLTVSGAVYPGVGAELPPASDLYTYALITISERATGLPNARPARTYQCLPSANGTLTWVQLAAAP